MGGSVKSGKGSASLEATGAILLFTFLFFLICETSFVFLKAATAQFVLTREARTSLAYNQIKLMNVSQIQQRIRDRAERLGLNTSGWSISVCKASGAASGCAQNTLGSGNDLLILNINPGLKIFGGTVPLNYNASVLISRESSV